MASPDHLHRITQISQLHMAEDKQPPLLQLVDKQNELAGRAGVGHHQQHLRPPELHVIFPHIQHEQILAHLHPEETIATTMTLKKNVRLMFAMAFLQGTWWKIRAWLM